MRLILGLLLHLWVELSCCSGAFNPPISVATEVPTNSSVQATIVDTQIYNGAATYVNGFRVYLATSAQGDENTVFYHSDCNLIHDQTICDPLIKVYDDHVSFLNSTFNVTIPPTVGPTGPNYVLTVRLLQTDGSYYGGSINSNIFDLTDATGSWGWYRENGYTLWGTDGTPCTGYSCVQNCSNGSSSSPSPNDTNQAYESCANSCPGVSIDFQNSTRGGQPTGALTSTSSCALNVPTSASATRTGGATGSGSLGTASATAINHSNVAPSNFSAAVVMLYSVAFALALGSLCG